MMDEPLRVTVDHDAFSSHGIKEGSFPKPLLLFHHNTLESRFDIVTLYQSIPDSDSDGMADDWELAHFNSLTKANRSTDHDKDGFSDVAEFSAGTDPIDAGSLLRFSLPMSLKNEMVMLRWDSIPGRRYRIERSIGNPHHWTVLANGIKATMTTLEHVDSRIDNGRPVFYRLVVEVD